MGNVPKRKGWSPGLGWGTPHLSGWRRWNRWRRCSCVLLAYSRVVEMDARGVGGALHRYGTVIVLKAMVLVSAKHHAATGSYRNSTSTATWCCSVREGHWGRGCVMSMCMRGYSSSHHVAEVAFSEACRGKGWRGQVASCWRRRRRRIIRLGWPCCFS